MCWGHNVGIQGGHNVGAQSICGGIINLWGYNQFVFVGARHAVPPHCCHLLLPFHAILCHPMPSHALPYHAAATMLPCCHTPTMLPCHDLTPMPCPCHSMLLLLSAAICCHPCHPMLCPQISAPKFKKPTQWWEYSGGGTIEGIIWEHNVDTLWGYNGEAQCGGTMWGHNVGAQDGHNVGAQCGSNSTRWGHNVGII
jgi:hypothetical protein